MGLVDNHHLPVTRAELLHQAATIEGLNHREHVFVAGWIRLPIEQFAKVGVTQHLAECRSRLFKNLALVSDKQQLRLSTALRTHSFVVERRNNRLAGTGGSHQQITGAAMLSLMGQAVEDDLLEWLGLKVEPRSDGDDISSWSASLLLKCPIESRLVVGIVRVIRRKLRIVPERLEVRFGRIEQ